MDTTRLWCLVKKNISLSLSKKKTLKTELRRAFTQRLSTTKLSSTSCEEYRSPGHQSDSPERYSALSLTMRNTWCSKEPKDARRKNISTSAKNALTINTDWERLNGLMRCIKVIGTKQLSFNRHYILQMRDQPDLINDKHLTWEWKWNTETLKKHSLREATKTKLTKRVLPPVEHMGVCNVCN